MDWFAWMAENHVMLVPVIENRNKKLKTVKTACWFAGRRQLHPNGYTNVVGNRWNFKGATAEEALSKLKAFLDAHEISNHWAPKDEHPGD